MNDNFKHFENYRRERNKRRLEGAPLRELGDNAMVLRQLEEAEQREVREQQLTREVHEFFQAATKQAAGIVAHVTESAEERLRESVSREMAEFLQETIRRAQELMGHVAGARAQGVARQELEPHMQNLVGPILDGFRFAGDIQTAEQHVGQDPFSTDLGQHDVGNASIEPQGAQDAVPIHEPIAQADEPVTESAGPSPSAPTELAVEGIQAALGSWFGRLLGQPEQAKEMLKLLVRSSMMTKEEARAIWGAVQTATAG